MKLIIDIPKDIYECVKKPIISDEIFDEIVEAFRHGTPLPNGHGRLIDISPYEEYFNTEISYDDGNHIHTKYTNLIPTIIDADTAESEDKE